MSYLKFTQPKLNDFEYASGLEWIEANGIGGYSSSTVSGAHSRRYHGILVAAMAPPVERVVLLSKLDETIVIGGQRHELSSNQYPGAVHPGGFRYLKSFERKLFPEFVYEAGGVTIKKTIAALNGENSTVVVYDVIEAGMPFVLELLPLASMRDFHSIGVANDAINRGYTFERSIFRTQNYSECPAFYVSVPGAIFKPTGNWYYNIEFAIERYRGLDFREDLYNHGILSVELKTGDRIGIIISTDDPDGRNALTLIANEATRRENLLLKFNHATIRQLVLAADQFIVKRGEDLKTIIAGYPWFSDWGRDTMIALPGLCLVTGRYDDARRILQGFALYLSKGMLPNRFPDHGEAPEYNTIDATLWYFYAICKYYEYTSDIEFVKTLIPVLEDIILRHDEGTRYHIHVDTDGLLSGGEDGVQLTWMDAKVDDWVVTPRRGKAVEINALWHNALRVMARLLIATGKTDQSDAFVKRADVVKQSFNRLFWNESRGCLFDWVDGDQRNEDVRPNQIYAISLPFALLSDEKAKRVLDCVTEKLLTPRGLRSLSPDQREYKPVYGGDRWQRDGAYHQGTVWSFLIGPYIDALVRVSGETGKSQAAEILRQFFDHLHEAGVGSVSEIFDGDRPHHPRGCFAQAWGVGEVLRAALEYDLVAHI